MKKIFVTGGHFTPALAVIEQLTKERKWQIFFVGRKTTLEDDSAVSLEYQVLSKIGNVQFLPITTGRLQRQFFVNTFQSVRAAAKVVIGMVQGFYFVWRYQPEIILSFGGYIAFPIVLAGFFFRIPIITHEQTVTSGLANRLIAHLADKVLVSWPESLSKFPPGKVVLTGNPLRREILAAGRNRKVINPREKLPLVYVTGGNQGSHVINSAVLEVLPKLLSRFRLIHQTGDSQIFKDFDKAAEVASKLPPPNKKRYTVKKFLDVSLVAKTMASCDFVVSRPGANIITELLFFNRPAILIPIPKTGGQEQQKNAQFLAGQGLAKILNQKDLTGERLLWEMKNFWANIDQFLSPKDFPKELLANAARKIAEQVEIFSQKFPHDY